MEEKIELIAEHFYGKKKYQGKRKLAKTSKAFFNPSSKRVSWCRDSLNTFTGLNPDKTTAGNMPANTPTTIAEKARKTAYTWKFAARSQRKIRAKLQLKDQRFHQHQQTNRQH